MLFLANEQELDCISDSGEIIGKIKFDAAQDNYLFCPDSSDLTLSDAQKSQIAAQLTALSIGGRSIPMADDD